MQYGRGAVRWCVRVRTHHRTHSFTHACMHIHTTAVGHWTIVSVLPSTKRSSSSRWYLFNKKCGAEPRPRLRGCKAVVPHRSVSRQAEQAACLSKKWRRAAGGGRRAAAAAAVKAKRNQQQRLEPCVRQGTHAWRVMQSALAERYNYRGTERIIIDSTSRNGAQPQPRRHSPSEAAPRSHPPSAVPCLPASPVPSIQVYTVSLHASAICCTICASCLSMLYCTMCPMWTCTARASMYSAYATVKGTVNLQPSTVRTAEVLCIDRALVDMDPHHLGSTAVCARVAACMCVFEGEGEGEEELASSAWHIDCSTSAGSPVSSGTRIDR